MIDTKEIIKEIERLFPEILIYKFNNPTFLIGGSIKNIILNQEIKDLDFIQISESNDEIFNFIKYYDFNYTENSFGDRKIVNNNINIDFFKVKELSDIIEYEYDGLVYDIRYNQIIPITIYKSLNSHSDEVLFNDKFKHPNNKRVEERYNNIMCNKHKLNKLITYPSKIIIDGVEQ